jgi:hypothetical protein
VSSDVQSDIVLLSTTRVRVLIDRIHTSVDGLVSKQQLVQAWILCVAAEHTKQRTNSSSTVKPWDFSITSRDAERALELQLQLQRRAKLGGVSFRDFLKKFTFDREGMTVASEIIRTFCEVAGEPEVRVR